MARKKVTKMVVVASSNPVKLRAVTRGFTSMFPNHQWSFQTVEVTSDVSDQPSCDHETLRGAINRTHHAKLVMPRADFWVGIEGGIEENGNQMETFAWIVILSQKGMMGKARSATFFLPEKVARLIRKGKELGEADDIVFGRTDSKKKNGSVGILTGNVIDRASYYANTVVLALIPFKHDTLYTYVKGR